MMQLSPQSRIFVATEPVDFRTYAGSTVMLSPPHSAYARAPYQDHDNAQKAVADCA
jgi:hypothetical protein